MSDPRTLAGDDPAAAVASAARDALADCRAAGADPCLGTVLMSDDPADRAFMDRKHDRCAEEGVETRRVDVDSDAPAERCYRAVEDLASDPEVTAVFVQVPLPAHVDEAAVRRRVPPTKDVDCFHPENVGRLVAGDPRIEPVTPRAVCRMLDHYDVPVAGRDAVVVGRSNAIGKPLAAMLLSADATVTVAHSRTRDLGAVTRRADLLVTAAGAPGLVDGSMVREGVVVVDVSANRVGGEGETRVVGDVDAASVAPEASALTPVPGGVGPVTIATLLENVAAVTATAAGVDVDYSR
ncbi:MAG: bifunctional 5,10-methylenetetrahydrofolate dehydrogenase/5,10-methenyltetrahydrofolate cyclohydrolase [Haloplanus sp.]